jgi:hypothetical protein
MDDDEREADPSWGLGMEAPYRTPRDWRPYIFLAILIAVVGLIVIIGGDRGSKRICCLDSVQGPPICCTP